MSRWLGLLLALGVGVAARTVGPSDKAIEIIHAKVDRHFLLPQLLSPDLFFMEQHEVGKVYIAAPGGSDINDWLDAFKGKGMKVLVFPGRDYELQSNERGVRDTMTYSLMPSENAHNFFVGNLDLVVQIDPDDTKNFADQQRLVHKLTGFLDKEVVLILRPD